MRLSLRHRLFAAVLAFAFLLPGASAQRRDNALFDAATAEQPAVVGTLQKLAAFEAGSEAPGLAATRYLESELQALGFAVLRFKPAAGAPPGDALVGKIKGKGGKNLLLLARMNSAQPAAARGAPFRVEGSRAYGTGIADGKGGIAVILATLRLMKTYAVRDYGVLTVMFSTGEPNAAPGARELMQHEARQSDYVLSFEPAVAGAEVFNLAGAGIARVQASIRGKATPVGAAPPTAGNALVEAADLVQRTLDLDDSSRGLRFQWTGARSGGTPDLVPDSASLDAHMRYLRNEDFDLAVKTLEERAQKKRLPDTEVTLVVTRERPAFNAGEGGRRMADKAVAFYKEAGGAIELDERSDAGLDATYAALGGKPVLDALGLPGAGLRAGQPEYVQIDAVARRLYMSVRLLMDLGAGK